MLQFEYIYIYLLTGVEDYVHRLPKEGRGLGTDMVSVMDLYIYIYIL